MGNPYHASMTEHALSLAVVECAVRLGWRAYFVPDWAWRLILGHVKRNPRKGREWSRAGFPDLVLVRWPHPEPRLLVVELKSAQGTVRPEQLAWLEALQACGVDVRVWRPAHWHAGEIEVELRS